MRSPSFGPLSISNLGHEAAPPQLAARDDDGGVSAASERAKERVVERRARAVRAGSGRRLSAGRRLNAAAAR